MAWLTNWSKRKKITLTGGSSGAQTNYQIKLNVTYDSDMQADFDDLRFTKSDGTTLIDAWLESKTDSTSAIIWVEFPTTPANTSTEDYYMYYGNSGASSNWDGDDTFLKFDDFENGFSGWSGQTGQYSTSTTEAYDGTHSLKKTGSDGHDNRLYKSETTSDVEVSVRVYNSDGLNCRGGSYIGVSGDNDHYYATYVDPNDHIYLREFNNGGYVSTIATGSISAISSAQWIEIIIRKYGTKVDVLTYSSAGSLLGSITGTTLSYTTGYVGLHTYDQTTYTDQFIAKKYATNPATYGFGSEETGSGGIIMPIFMHYYNQLRSR